MTEQRHKPTPHRLLWGGITIATLLLIGATWALLGVNGELLGAPPTDTGTTGRGVDNSSHPSDGPSEGSSQPATPTDESPVPLQPTAAPTPLPGATESVEKPSGTLEGEFDDAVEVAKVLDVEITEVKAVTAGRDIPGEVSGPAVEVGVRITNRGKVPADTAGTAVTLTYNGDDRTPAPEVLDDSSAVFPASIAPGQSMDARYVFSVPLVTVGDICILVDVLASEPDVAFIGPRP